MQKNFNSASEELPLFDGEDGLQDMFPAYRDGETTSDPEKTVQEEYTLPPQETFSEESAAEPVAETGFRSSNEEEQGSSPAMGSAPEPPKKFDPPPSPVLHVPENLKPSPEYGAFLRKLREANGLSLEDVSGLTRIKTGYLDALERECYANLPGIAYILAYIRVVAGCYGVPPEDIAVLTSEVRKNLEFEAPEENKTVVGYEPSDENQVLLHRILLAGAGGIVAVAVLITLLVLFLTSGSGSSGKNTVSGGAPDGLDEDRLVEIQPAPALQTHVLPVRIRK